MFYPDSFPKHFIETSINILTMQGWTMHAIVWKIRVILLQIFVWIVDLKGRERSTEYLKKDIKYRRVTIEVHVWKICCHKRLWQKDWIAFPLGDDIIIPQYWADIQERCENMPGVRKRVLFLFQDLGGFYYMMTSICLW